MNNKSLLLVLIICGLIVSALIFRNGRLVALAIPFLIYLMMGVLQMPDEMKLSARRRTDRDSLPAGELVETQVVIVNEGNPLVNLYLQDSLASTFEIIEGSAHQRRSLSTGESAELRYSFKPARGVYSWNSIRAIASDPFGLFDLQREVPASGEVLVHPAALRIRSSTLAPRLTLQQTAGPVSARAAGSGTDFYGIREYRAGDPLRRLNWRMAARHPYKLFTNEFEREEIADFGFILDTRRQTSSSEMEEALFEHSVRAVASLSEKILKDGNRVSLLVFGEFMASVFPGYGKGQLNLLRRTLAQAKLGENLPFRYLEYFPTRLFPAHSMVIVFSAVDAHDLETYARLLAFGYEVVLISSDPVDFIARMYPDTEINALAVRAARIERTVHLKQLLKIGVRVINWQVNQPLETILRQAAGHSVRGVNQRVRS